MSLMAKEILFQKNLFHTAFVLGALTGLSKNESYQSEILKVTNVEH